MTSARLTVSDTATADAVAAALAAEGWTRTDRTAYGRTSAEFAHPATAATVTVTEDAWSGTSAHLWCDNTTDPNWLRHWSWKVDCFKPEAPVIAAAAKVILALGDDPGRSLAEVLTEAGWPTEHEHAKVSGRVLETRFFGLDGTEACFLPGDDEPDGWLIERPRSGGGIASYLPSSDTPPAVLAALALTPASPAV